MDKRLAHVTTLFSTGILLEETDGLDDAQALNEGTPPAGVPKLQPAFATKSKPGRTQGKAAVSNTTKLPSHHGIKAIEYDMEGFMEQSGEKVQRIVQHQARKLERAYLQVSWC